MAWHNIWTRLGDGDPEKVAAGEAVESAHSHSDLLVEDASLSDGFSFDK